MQTKLMKCILYIGESNNDWLFFVKRSVHSIWIFVWWIIFTQNS